MSRRRDQSHWKAAERGRNSSDRSWRAQSSNGRTQSSIDQSGREVLSCLNFHPFAMQNCRNYNEGRSENRTTLVEVVSGDVLLSHAVARAVPSALRGLASGFGMGPGVSLSLWSPKLYGDIGPSAVDPIHSEESEIVEREPYLRNRTVDASALDTPKGEEVLGKSSAY